MKKLYYIMICILLASCIDQEDTLIDQQQPTTRGIVNPSNSSVTNPTLLTDWENLTTVVLNTSTPNNLKTASLPWVAGATTLIPPSIRNDIKKEDGWTMLLHTFKNYGEDEKSNYIIFYNRFRGTLKVFYLLNETSSPNNHFLWEIRTDNGQHCTLFNVNPFFSLPSSIVPNNSSMILSNISDTPTDGVTYGWNGFQVNIPEYSTEFRNLLFTIHGYSKTVSSFSFTGKSSYTTQGTIIRNSPKEKKGIAEISGENSKKVLNDINNGKNGFAAGNIVKSAITALSSTIGAVQAVATGLKYLGKILAFSKGTQPSTDVVQLETKGEMSAEGSITSELTSAISAISGLNLYINNEDLGVWTLASTPEIRCERYTNVGGKLNPNGTYGTIENPYTLYPSKSLYAKVIINPTLEKYIVDKDITTEIITCDSLEGNLYGEKRNKPITQLLYKNNDIQLSSSNSSQRYNLPHNYQYRTNNRRLLYDWGIIKNDGDIALVTVKLTFKYNEKLTTVISSKMYEPIYIKGDTEWILQRGNPYIINDPTRFP